MIIEYIIKIIYNLFVCKW